MTASRPKRPTRINLGDRLIHGAESADRVRCDSALGPLDRLAIEMDRTWGVDRLCELVSVPTAQKYGAALAFLNAAIEANDPGRVADAAENCMKGLRAMDAEARALGRQPAPAEVWQYEYEGQRYGIVREAGDWTTLQDQCPGVVLYSMHEVAVALSAWKNDMPTVEAVKRAFPGAQVVSFRQRTQIEKDLEDEIPWC